MASDLNARAVDTERRRLSHWSNVEIFQGGLPAEQQDVHFDLIVIGELGYYFDAIVLSSVVESLCERLKPDGEILACHWKDPFDARRSDTVAVHDAFR